MTSRSKSVLLAGLLLACTSEAEAPNGPALPPPEAVKAAGKAMLTTRGFIHPEDPPGTRRSSRPHHWYIPPCNDWSPSGPITDAFGKTVSGPESIHLSWTIRAKPGMETVTESTLTAAFGPPHPATKTVMVGQAAPLGRHWTWRSKTKQGSTLIAEVRPDRSVVYHFAEISRIGGGGTSASMMVDCLIEDHGTPGG